MGSPIRDIEGHRQGPAAEPDPQARPCASTGGLSRGPTGVAPGLPPGKSQVQELFLRTVFSYRGQLPTYDSFRSKTEISEILEANCGVVLLLNFIFMYLEIWGKGGQDRWHLEPLTVLW